MDINTAIQVLTDANIADQKNIDSRTLAIQVLKNQFQPEFQARDTALGLLSKEKQAHEDTQGTLSDTLSTNIILQNAFDAEHAENIKKEIIISDKVQIIAEKEAALIEKDAIIAAKDAIIAAKEAVVVEIPVDVPVV